MQLELPAFGAELHLEIGIALLVQHRIGGDAIEPRADLAEGGTVIGEHGDLGFLARMQKTDVVGLNAGSHLQQGFVRNDLQDGLAGHGHAAARGHEHAVDDARNRGQEFASAELVVLGLEGL